MSSTNGTSDPEFPSIYVESLGLLFNSIFMYGLPDLHALARKNLLAEGDADRVLSLPVTSEEFLAVVKRNRDVIEQNFAPGDSKLYGTALFLVENEIKKQPSANAAVTYSELVDFNDTDSHKQLVYGIFKHDVTKRICVAFRGSATVKDLAIDADGRIMEFDDPTNPNAEQIGVHQGFHKYLNGDARGKHKGRTLFGNDDSKYSEIMSKLKTLYAEYPDYHLYVTGHSLGASLAQLFAMEAACNGDFIPKPVTTINFASPKVGDVYFRNCFEDLEDRSLLRCIRFRNDKDIIPTLPDRQNLDCLRNLSCRPSVFRHGGPSILLHPDGSFEVRYEKRDKETVMKFIKEAEVTRTHGVGFTALVPTILRYSKQFLKYHSCMEYMNRFREFGTHGGDKVFLNDIYKNEAALKKLLEGEFQGKQQ